MTEKELVDTKKLLQEGKSLHEKRKKLQTTNGMRRELVRKVGTKTL